jgi:hypothetical protein
MTVTEQDGRFEVISAFADGERVDAQALRAALADEACRDFLIDTVAMREVVSAGAMTTVAGGETATRTIGGRLIGLAAAAVVAVGVGVGGYAIGHQQSRIVTVAAHPPMEAEAVASVETAPAPTQVIRLDDATRGGGR